MAVGLGRCVYATGRRLDVPLPPILIAGSNFRKAPHPFPPHPMGRVADGRVRGFLRSIRKSEKGGPSSRVTLFATIPYL